MGEPSSKDTIMKMLLSTPNPSQADIQAALTVKMDKQSLMAIRESVIGTSKLSNYLQQLNGQGEKINPIQLDHCYSKPWNWRPDNSYVKPAKTLFVTNPLISTKRELEEDIDVDIENEAPKPAYDETRGYQLMNETEKHIKALRSDPGEENWDSLIDRTDWTLAQNRLFDRTARILHNDRLARLTYEGSWNEPVLRRIAVNKSARRLRTLFSTFAWQTKLLQWLHSTLLEILETPYLIAYVDILQTLKKKVPILTERILANPIQGGKSNPEALKILLKKSWDPTSSALACHLPKRLPGNPLIVVVPSGAGTNNLNNPKIQRWHSHFSTIGTVVVVSTNNLNTTKSTVVTSLDHMIASTRARISELKSEHPGKNIILVGFNSGAALACQVALLEPVLAVICLGFPVNTVDEKRGQPDDTLLNLNVPILFVIGQHAATAQVEDVEDMRERLRVENGLVIVGAADDQLRINKSKQSAEGITQTMLDRCVVDEIADFVGTLLLEPFNISRQENTRSRIKVVEKKRKITINDDLFMRKSVQSGTNIQQGAYNSSLNPYIKRGKTITARGVGRTKWTGQGTNEGLSLQKKTVLNKDSILTNSKQAADKIGSTVRIKCLTPDTRVNQQFKILPQFKFIGKDEISSVTTPDNSFVDQLTPDRLLEMPVIIQDDSLGDQLKVVIPEDGMPSGQSEVQCATIFLKNKDALRTRDVTDEGVLIMRDTQSRNSSITKHIFK
ncbi:KAT8 regulatory NSL complex subunit 3 isoform X2 [Cimex lectularius]|nr:KAT8 regulatory NSL complex subunit 3 isoform X2 [Cimex lectularius]XP_024083145.1 KAT8 regulatory NSL complex subunit 3 isoform X2 [Cimex lectularius]